MENQENPNTPPPIPIILEKKENNFHSRLDMMELRESLEKVKSEIAKVIVGQQDMIEHLLAALLSNGHVLIEGVPGVAKTITAKLLAKTIDVDFSRIQFTPDLMPSDILGTSIFSMKNSEFEFKKEHYFGYTKNKNSTSEYEVQHPKWKHYHINNYEISLDFKENYGDDFEFLNAVNPCSVMLAEGSEVKVKTKNNLG